MYQDFEIMARGGHTTRTRGSPHSPQGHRDVVPANPHAPVLTRAALPFVQAAYAMRVVVKPGSEGCAARAQRSCASLFNPGAWWWPKKRTWFRRMRD